MAEKNLDGSDRHRIYSMRGRVEETREGKDQMQSESDLLARSPCKFFSALQSYFPCLAVVLLSYDSWLTLIWLENRKKTQPVQFWGIQSYNSRIIAVVLLLYDSRSTLVRLVYRKNLDGLTMHLAGFQPHDWFYFRSSFFWLNEWTIQESSTFLFHVEYFGPLRCKGSSTKFFSAIQSY